jgi:hypothetical protein
MILLFRVMTNDNWGAVQIAASREPDLRTPMGLPAVNALLNTPGCAMGANSTTQTCAFMVMQQLLPSCVDDRELLLLKVVCPTADGSCNSTCGSRLVSSLYFAVFLMIATFILLNIVIAVLMQQMTDIEVDSELYVSGALKRNSMHRIMWRIRRNSRAILHTQLVQDGLLPPDLLHKEIEFIPPKIVREGEEDEEKFNAVSCGCDFDCLCHQNDHYNNCNADQQLYRLNPPTNTCVSLHNTPLTRCQVSPLQLMNLIESNNDEDEEGRAKGKKQKKALNIQVKRWQPARDGDDDDKWFMMEKAAPSAPHNSPPLPSPPLLCPSLAAAKCCGFARSQRNGLNRRRHRHQQQQQGPKNLK